MQKLTKRIREIGDKYESLSGNYASLKMKNDVQFESSLERDFILTLEFDNQVLAYVEQPMSIPYRDTNSTQRSYIPDFYVERVNKVSQLVEIKHSSYLKKYDDILNSKFKYARKYCKQNGYEFVLLTEKEIRSDSIYISNLKFLSRYKNISDKFEYLFGRNEDFVNRSEIIDLIFSSGKIKIIELLEKSNKTSYLKEEIVYWVWTFIADDLVKVNLHQKLTINSVIWIDEE